MIKKTLVSAIAAILCVFLVTNAISSGVKTYADALKEIAENSAMNSGASGEVGLDEQSGLLDNGSNGGSTSTDTNAPSDETGENGEAGEAGATTGKPQDGIESLNYYNTAIAKAVNAKVGYDKERMTDNEKMDGSVALQAMKSLVYKFMGIGADNKYTATIEKGKWEDVAFITASKLTASDVTAATCTESGSDYVITLKLKNGSSNAGKSNPTTAPNTALDKSGICVGSEDKGYFDHKTASVIYDAIAGTYAGAEISEKYTNATVKAKINAETGELVELVVEWNQEVTLSKLAGMSATASGISHVTYKNFKY